MGLLCLPSHARVPVPWPELGVRDRHYVHCLGLDPVDNAEREAGQDEPTGTAAILPAQLGRLGDERKAAIQGRHEAPRRRLAPAPVPQFLLLDLGFSVREKSYDQDGLADPGESLP